jgi:hypothetical protein
MLSSTMLEPDEELRAAIELELESAVADKRVEARWFEATALAKSLPNTLLSAALALTGFRQARAAADDFHAQDPGYVADKGQYAFKSRCLNLMPFVFARSFVFAIDDVIKVAERLNRKDMGRPRPTLASYLDRLPEPLATLKEVRDSSAHQDERLIGRGGQGKSNRAITPNNGVRTIGNLSGDFYIWTMLDGTESKVEVGLDTLNAGTKLAQAAIDSVAWLHPDPRRR